MTVSTELEPPPGRVYLSAPDVGNLEETYLLDAVRSGWVAPQGPYLDAFEAELARRTGRQYAVALSSGTAALHLGLLELGVGPGDTVIVPTMTFVATANAVVYTGATPVFVDVAPDTGNLDPGTLADVLASMSRKGSPPSAVVAVDLLGRCAAYGEILEVCDRYGIPLLEDAAEALGSACERRPAGSFGAAAVLSFNGNKVATTSGGGALVTDDRRLARRIRHLATQAREPVTHYEHRELGFNYRLSNLLAAVGCAQLARLDGMIRRRRRLRDRYRAAFMHVRGTELFQGADDQEDNCWLTAVLVDEGSAGWRPRDLADALAAADIESRPLWKPMHLQPVFAGAPHHGGTVAEQLFRAGLALPSGSGLDSAAVARIEKTIASFVGEVAGQ